MIEPRPYRLSGNPFDREFETVAVKRIFFLSVEGQRSEPSYFNNLQRRLNQCGESPVALHVLAHQNDGRSSPSAVMELLDECRGLREGKTLIPMEALELVRQSFDNEEITRILEDDSSVAKARRVEFRSLLSSLGINLDYRKFLASYAPDCCDRFVVVLDRDAECHTRESLVEVISRCREEGYLCCLTNPCFDFWLLLHLDDIDRLRAPEEKERILANRKVSRQHTYLSSRVSRLAHHAKQIRGSVFDHCYYPNLGKAMKAARTFAGDAERVLDQVGTTIPDLMHEIGVSSE